MSKDVKTSSPLFLLLIFSAIIINITSVQANPTLNLIVRTDKQKYYAKEAVQVYGNLTLDGVLVTNGLVGIQIQDPQDKLILVRTLFTGNPPSETPYIFLQYVLPCDSAGNAKYSFQKGTLAYFEIKVKNLDIQPRNVTLPVNVFYGDDTPFGYYAMQTKIPGESNPSFRMSIPIPKDAVLGPAKVYANAYTDWPKLAGTPYCSEVNATFEITGTAGGGQEKLESLSSKVQQSSEMGNYNMTFGLPRKTLYGNCTVYVTSIYFGESVYNSTTFTVYILGDLGGGIPPKFFQFDGKVDGKDLSLFLMCYTGAAPPEVMYLADLGGGIPPKFFDFDGVVDGKDLSLFLMCYTGIGP